MKKEEFREMVEKNDGNLYLTGKSVVLVLNKKEINHIEYTVMGFDERKVRKVFPKARKKQNDLFRYKMMIETEEMVVYFSPSKDIEEFLQTKTLNIDALAVKVHKDHQIFEEEIVDPFDVSEKIKENKITLMYAPTDENEIDKLFEEYMYNYKINNRKQILSVEELEELEKTFDVELKKGIYLKGIYFKETEDGEYVKSEFLENPLEFYRLIRKTTELKMDIDEDIYAIIKKAKEEIKQLNEQSVLEELKEVLKLEEPSVFFEKLDEIEMLDLHFKELKNMKTYHTDKYYKTLKLIDKMKAKDEIERFATLLHLLEKEHIRKFLERFNLPRYIEDITDFVMENYMQIHKLSKLEAIQIVKLIEKLKQIYEKEKEIEENSIILNLLNNKEELEEENLIGKANITRFNKLYNDTKNEIGKINEQAKIELITEKMKIKENKKTKEL